MILKAFLAPGVNPFQGNLAFQTEKSVWEKVFKGHHDYFERSWSSKKSSNNKVQRI